MSWGRTVSLLKGVKMMECTVDHDMGIKVAVKGGAIWEVKGMVKILKRLEEMKMWEIKEIDGLERLKRIHDKIIVANNILSDMLCFTAPNFDPAHAAPPLYKLRLLS